MRVIGEISPDCAFSAVGKSDTKLIESALFRAALEVILNQAIDAAKKKPGNATAISRLKTAHARAIKFEKSKNARTVKGIEKPAALLALAKSINAAERLLMRARAFDLNQPATD